MMFKKLLGKVVGKALAPVIDRAIVKKLDRRTGGAASKIEAAVDRAKHPEKG